MADEIRRDASGVLDEVVVADCHFHLEQMDTDAWWIGVTKGGKTLHIWLRREGRRKVVANVTEDEIGCAEVVTDSL